MEIFHYEIRGKELVPRDERVALPGEGSSSWTHAVAPDTATIRRLLQDLGVPFDIEDICTRDKLHPEFLVVQGWRLLSFPVHIPGTWSRAYLVTVMHGLTSFTFTTEVVPYVEKFREQIVAKGADSSERPLSELLEVCGRADRLALQAMRDQVDALAQRIEHQPRTIALNDIRRLKQAVVRCGNVCEDQVFCLAAVATPMVVKDASEEAISLRNTMLALVRYVDRSFDRLDSRARELEAELQVYYQQRTEDRLRVLTVISAVFMPLTLITGIYGMNFETMPELSVPHAYFICLGAMAAITATMLVYFYRRGWLAPSEITKDE